MKKSILFTLIVLCFSKFCFGQQTTAHVIVNDEIIVESWTFLEESFKLRSNVFLNLTGVLSHSATIDTVLLKNTRVDAIEFIKTLDSIKFLSGNTVLAIDKKNYILSQSIGKTLWNLENNDGFKNRKDIKEFITKLEEVENEIWMKKKGYTEICIDRKRKDLIFPKDKNDIAPEVHF